jgi:hypothetical protein
MPRRPFLAIAGLFLGTVGIWYSFRLAEQETGFYELPFLVFWASFAVGLLPLLHAALRISSERARLLAVLAAGVFTTWPKMLRTWGGPLYSDEFGHLYQTRRVLQDGFFPGGENPLLKVAPDFPLLHWATAGLSRLGLDLWSAASAVAASAHVLTLLAVYYLVKVISRSTRAGVIGAFLYVLQPGWLFFSAQFAYETLALPLLTGTLALALWARSRQGTRRHVALVGVVLGAGLTALTHHFASFTLGLLLLAVLLTGRSTTETHLRTRRGDLWVTLVAFAVIGGWLASRSLALSDYYAPALESALDRLRGARSEAGRVAFAGSQVPVFERWAGYGFPFALLGLYLWSLLGSWRRLLRERVAAVFSLLAGSFFASLPLIFTVAGSEAAHRWWAYSYLGLAVVIGTAWATLSPGALRPNHRVMRGLAIVLVAVGGTAAGTTVGYRFPGPPEVGNDARSVSIEGRQVAEWLYMEFGDSHASGQTVLTDRYTAQQLVGYGLQRTSRPSGGYPAWDLLYSDDPEVLRELAPMLANDRVSLVVVDARLATTRPVLGYWFNRTEPGAFGTELIRPGALAKFECAAWSTPLYRAGHLGVYAIDTERLVADPEVCP